MDIANLVLKYIESLKWWSLVFLVLFLYKKPIERLIDNLSKLSIGGDKGLKIEVQKLQLVQKLSSTKEAKREPEQETIESSSNEIEHNDIDISNVIHDIPDDAFMFLFELGKMPIKETYFANDDSELKNLAALSKCNVMEQISSKEFKITHVGKKLLEGI